MTRWTISVWIACLAIGGCQRDAAGTDRSGTEITETTPSLSALERADPVPEAAETPIPKSAPRRIVGSPLVAPFPIAPHVTGNEDQGHALLLHDGRLHALLWSKHEDPVTFEMLRVSAQRLSSLEGVALEPIALSAERQGLIARTSAAPPRTHRATVLFGVGRFFVVLELSAAEAISDEEALHFARSVSEAEPQTTAAVGGCALSITPACHECIEGDGHDCMFGETSCRQRGQWFVEGCPDSYEQALTHKTMTRRGACVVADGSEVIHQYTMVVNGAETPGPAVFAEDCARLHGRIVPSVPHVRPTR